MRRAALACLVFVWAVITIVSGYLYAASRVALPDAAPGYETSWDFQLFMFGLFRLPVFVAGLGIVLWLTRAWWLEND